jgi:hypothetical protein
MQTHVRKLCVFNEIFFFFIVIILSGMRQSTRYCGHFWPIVPAPDDGDCGAIGGINIGRKNRSTWRKPAPVPLCPPQIQHELTRARTRAVAVGSQRLISRVMARPFKEICGVAIFIPLVK